MEAEKEAPGFRVTQLILPLLIGALGTWAWQQYPSESLRPDSPRTTQRMTRQAQKVDARLWQDPFDAVAQHQRAEGTPGNGVVSHHQDTKLNEDIWEKLRAIYCVKPDHSAGTVADYKLRKLTVFAVMVSGGPYFEDTEQRRRIRYAVLSGINALSQNYTPDDPEHIQFVDFESTKREPTKDGALSGPQLPRVLPYEWVRIHQSTSHSSRTGPDGDLPEDALVLWLNADYFSAKPLTTLYQLLQRILTPTATGEIGDCTPPDDTVWSHLRIRVLGPNSSNGLQALWQEATELKHQQTPLHTSACGPNCTPDGKSQAERSVGLPPLNPWVRALDVAFYSPRATVHECVLFDGCSANSDRTLSERFEALLEGGYPFPNLHFIRTTAPDDKLANTLKDELERRRIVPGPEQHVVLISEWDTLYGWNLPRTFRAALEPPECGTGDESEIVTSERTSRTCVHRYSYLRGLDGEAARQKDKDPDKSDSSNTSARNNISDFTEKPEGEAQFDYLRRLATKLGHLEASIRQQNPNASIRAIGVLASDVYDKLLILRALRQYFPEAVFFTTDLDERLLHPSQNDWTRNLLIVSGFGFELANSLQKDIPPFRDGYQTSYFLATQMALRSRNGWQQNVVDRWLNPRVFEIGRTETIDLTAKPPGFKLNRCQDLEACVHIHPSTEPKFASPGISRTLFGLAGSMFCALFLSVAFPGFREWVKRYRYWLISSSLGLLALGLCAWLVGSQSYASMEPWRWLEGISIWPSELIRLSAVILALLCIRQTLCFEHSNKLRRQLNDIAQDFFGAEKAESVSALCAKQWLPKRQDLWQTVTRHWALDTAAGPSPEKASKAVSAEDLWDEYMRQILRRPFRALVHASLLGLFGLCMLLALGFPEVPARGLAALVVDRIVLACAVVTFCYLLVLVFDTARVSERLVDYFGDPGTNIVWSHRQSTGDDTDGLKDEACVSLKNTHFVGRLTTVVGSLVWYPFFIVILLMAARSRFFDNWHTPAGLWAVYAVSFLMIFVRIRGLGHAAAKAKSLEITRITQSRDQTLLTWSRNAQDRLTRADRILGMLENYHEGAFAPLSSKPLFRAILALIGTQSVIQVLEAFVLNSVR